MKTTTAITTELRQELSSEAAAMSQSITQLRGYLVETDDDLEYVGQLVRSAKERWKELEERRTAITKPINEALRQVNALFKPVQDPLKQVEVIIKSKIAAYTMAQRASQERAMRDAAAAIQSGDVQAAAEHVAAIVPASVLAGVGVREVWTFRVVDESLVPREFLRVDEDKIKATIPKGSDPLPIPGIEFVKEGRVAVRT